MNNYFDLIHETAHYEDKASVQNIKDDGHVTRCKDVTNEWEYNTHVWRDAVPYHKREIVDGVIRDKVSNILINDPIEIRPFDFGGYSRYNCFPSGFFSPKFEISGSGCS